jgi:hypothetical protein
MGYDSTNTFPKETKRKDVVEFLALLGFYTFDKKTFHFYKDEDYKYSEGLTAYLVERDDILKVSIHTTVWRSKADSDYHNFVIKQLKKRFGGSFHTDYGTGHYLKPPQIERTKAEAGCYMAYSNFTSSMSKAFIFLDNRETNHQVELTPELIKNVPFVAAMHPIIISNNLIVPYFVSCIEDYLKNTYIALLQYSDKKLGILKGSRILPDDLLSISNNQLTVEMAITKTMSFQNIHKICSYFRDLDTKLDLAGTLKKPYKRRKKSLFDTLNGIFEQRHLLIHRNIMIIDYSRENAVKDLEDIRAAIERIYKKLIDTYNWHDKIY